MSLLALYGLYRGQNRIFLQNPLLPLLFYLPVRRRMRLMLHAKIDNAVCIVIFSSP